jgi:hypothetical protein
MLKFRAGHLFEFFFDSPTRAQQPISPDFLPARDPVTVTSDLTTLEGDLTILKITPCFLPTPVTSLPVSPWHWHDAAGPARPSAGSDSD